MGRDEGLKLPTPPRDFLGQEGAVILLFALTMGILLGFLGLGVEVNSWYRQKGDLQKAADSAAILAALALDPSACGNLSDAEELGCLDSIAVASVAADGFGRAGNLGSRVDVRVTYPFEGQTDKLRLCVSLRERGLISALWLGGRRMVVSVCAVSGRRGKALKAG